MSESDNYIEPTDMPEEFRATQSALDNFAKVNYHTALDAVRKYNNAKTSTDHLRDLMVDLIRNNPPLVSVPLYFRDGRADYLWYSDFYDDITKEVYHQYRTFIAPAGEITPVNYTTELAKIGLPYFRELVELISLERLCAEFKEDEPLSEISETVVEDTQAEIQSDPVVEPPAAKQLLGKRSYEPKLNDKQYSLLLECVDSIKLFRRPVTVALLDKLLKGKLSESIQVTNQKTLVYLFDELANAGYIRAKWTSVAGKNEDFRSFPRGKNEERYGSEGNIISEDQLNSRRQGAMKEYVHGLETIDDMIELMAEC